MIPTIQGPYAYIELYAKSNRQWYFGFDVYDSTSNTGVNVSAYDALRMNVKDASGNVVIALTSGANQINAVNVSSVLINANATVMNVSPGYYGADVDFQTNGDWEPQFTATLRVDANNG